VKGQRFLFSGKELDEETGLYYFGARYYDPVRVRWASVDPAIYADKFLTSTPRALAAYLPMFGNPIGLVDPTGRQPALPPSAAPASTPSASSGAASLPTSAATNNGVAATSAPSLPGPGYVPTKFIPSPKASGTVPYVVDVDSTEFQKQLGYYVGTGHCASLAQSNIDMPRTVDWKPGESVVDNKELPRGAVLANFQGPNQTYAQAAPWSHTVLLSRYAPNGIYVYDQWKFGSNPQPATERLLRFDGSGSANNASLFRVVK